MSYNQNEIGTEAYLFLYYIREKFPLQIPVVLNKEKIGTIKIEFELNNKLDVKMLDRNKLNTIFFISKEVFEIGPLLQKDIELIIKIVNTYKKKLDSISELMMFGSLGQIQIFIPPGIFFLLKKMKFLIW